jgi:hypothetical protein
MAPEEKNVPLLNKLFEEALRRHGTDLNNVLRDVKTQIAGLSGADRAAVDGALERLLAFREPRPSGPLH